MTRSTERRNTGDLNVEVAVVAVSDQSSLREEQALDPACECLPETEEQKYTRLGEVIDSYQRRETNLIQVLHVAQTIFGYLPHEVQEFVAARMDLPLSKVSGVVSFYSLFSTEPKGRHTISVCLGTACYVRGGTKVLQKLTTTLGADVGQTTPDRRFSLQVMRCIGACGLAPALSVDGEIHKRVNPNKLPDLLKKYE